MNEAISSGKFEAIFVVKLGGTGFYFQNQKTAL